MDDSQSDAYIDQLEDSLDYALEVIMASEEMLSDDRLGARTRIRSVLQANNMFIKDMIDIGYVKTHGGEQ